MYFRGQILGGVNPLASSLPLWLYLKLLGPFWNLGILCGFDLHTEWTQLISSILLRVYLSFIHHLFSEMANAGIQLLGFVLSFLGFIGLIASTIMAEWKLSSYAGDNIITAQAMYEGLWKSCVSQSTGQIQCKVYDSLLQLTGLVQGTRGLMVGAILLAGIAILMAMVGMKCTTCLAENQEQKGKVALTGGILIIIAGLCALVGTSWYGNRIAKEFYDPFTPTNSRYEFGKALFVGWGSACLTIIGGAFLCCICTSKGSGKSSRYPTNHSAAPPGRDYV